MNLKVGDKIINNGMEAVVIFIWERETQKPRYELEYINQKGFHGNNLWAIYTSDELCPYIPFN